MSESKRVDLPLDFIYLTPAPILHLPVGISLWRFRFGSTSLVATEMPRAGRYDWEAAAGYCPECGDTVMDRPVAGRRGHPSGCWCCYPSRLAALLEIGS